MPESPNGLKEYLVKIGWNVDDLGLDKVKRSIGTVESNLNKLGNGFVGNMAKASASLLGLISDVNFAMADLLINTAQADVRAEWFARKMFTTEQNARSLTRALDTLGESYEDIAYMTPEQYEHLLELRDLGLKLEAPEELQETNKQVRDLIQEFNKLRTIASYSKDWVAYYLGQYLGDDFQKLLNMMKNFNEWAIQNLPKAANEVAKFFTIFYKMAKAGYMAIRDLWNILQNLWNSMSVDSKKGLAGITGMVMLLKSGPIGWLIFALTTILLLLDDFYTWQKGGKSLFGDKWVSLDGFFNNKDFDDLKTNTDDILSTVKKIIDKIGEGITKLTGWETPLDAIKSAFEFIERIVNYIDEVITAIATMLGLLGKDEYFEKEKESSSPTVRAYAEKTEEMVDALDSGDVNEFYRTIFDQLKTGWLNFWDMWYDRPETSYGMLGQTFGYGSEERSYNVNVNVTSDSPITEKVGQQISQGVIDKLGLDIINIRQRATVTR